MATPLDAVQPLLDRLEQPTPPGPDTTAEAIAWIDSLCLLMKHYLAGTPVFQEAVRTTVAARKSSQVHLFEFAHCGAVCGVRRKDPELIKLGLTALMIENLQFDDRDTIVELSLLCHSASKLALRVQDLRALLAFASPDFVTFANQFFKRPKIDRCIEAMGFVEDTTEDGGFYYRQV
jgi:hypothetical protein